MMRRRGGRSLRETARSLGPSTGWHVRKDYRGWQFSSRRISEDPMPRYKCKSIAALDIALGGLPAKMRVEADVGTEGITGRRKSRTLFQQSPPRNGSQCRARLEFCAGSGRKKGRGLRDIRGVPLPSVTSVSTTSNLGLPRSVTSLGQSTLTRVLEG